MTADPRIIDSPKQVRWISYRELRELSYMGASVVHEDAILPIRSAGIPIQVRNTMNPEAEGTMIVAAYPVDMKKHPVTGIAGKTGFSNLQIEMAMMNTQVGFGARVLKILADYGISYEHTPTSIDIISVIAETSYYEKVREKLMVEIDREFHPDKLFIEDGIALVTVVGEGISTNVGVAANVLKIISDAGINVKMIDAGCSELNIIIGVSESDYVRTIKALYAGLYQYL
jgi:aspartate kinase